MAHMLNMEFILAFFGDLEILLLLLLFWGGFIKFAAATTQQIIKLIRRSCVPFREKCN